MSLEANKALVRRYFDEVLDGKRTEVVYELFAPDCRVHFPHETEPRVGSDVVFRSLAAARDNVGTMVSHLEHLIAEGDLVAVGSATMSPTRLTFRVGSGSWQRPAKP